MKRRMMNQLSFGLACASLSVASITNASAMAGEPVLELHSVGLYDWPANEKDRMVTDAFRMLRDRLDDLAGEMDFDPEQAQLMKMGWDLLTARSALRLAPTDDGIDASFVLEPANGSTESIHQQLSSLAMMGGMEFEDQGNGVAQTMGPMGPMNLVFDKDRVWIAMGESEPASLEISGAGLPDGCEPIMSGRVDVNAMLQMFAPEIAAEFENNSEMLAGSGMSLLVGPDASVLEFAVGVDDESMHMVSRMIGAQAAMEAMGNTERTLFTKQDLHSVPVDAVQFRAMPTNIAGTLETLDTAMELSGENPLAEIEREIGVDIVEDILGNIGDRAIYYQSDSTGGGGLTSMVVLLDLRDADSMATAHGKLIARLNELAAAQIDGYARVHTWEIEGETAFSMTAPGIPIPIEPSWSISEDKLVFTLTPMALGEALAQLNGRRGLSIVNDEGFRTSVLSRIPSEGAVSLYYTDSPRMAAKGYGMTNLLTSALANAARSPEHPDRVEGSLMPSYRAFVDGIAPMGGVSSWDGEDLVTHYFGDRSMLVQMASGLGTVADLQGIMVPAFVAGATLPALGKARERANQLKSSTQLRSIVQALIVYGSENNDQPPASVDVLVEQGIISWDILVSPMASAYDGGPDYTVRLTEDAVSSFDALYIVAIDRAAYVNGEWAVSVGFADAHVEMIDSLQLDELLDMPRNKGAREDLQLPDF